MALATVRDRLGLRHDGTPSATLFTLFPGSSTTSNLMSPLGRKTLVHCISRFSPKTFLKPNVSKPTRWTSRPWINHSAGYGTTARTPPIPTSKRLSPWLAFPATLMLLAGVGVYAFDNYQPFRHTLLAVVRCSRVGGGYRQWERFCANDYP